MKLYIQLESNKTNYFELYKEYSKIKLLYEKYPENNKLIIEKEKIETCIFKASSESISDLGSESESEP